MRIGGTTYTTSEPNGPRAPFVERRSHPRVVLGPGARAGAAAGPALDIRPLRAARRLDSVRRASRLDEDTRRAVHGLTVLATRALGVPVALVTLVASERQFLLGATGLDGWWARLGETPIEYSLCRHVVATCARLVIPDTRVDPLARDNPLVLETGVRTYAGSPVRTRDGLCLGAFAALDFTPREWTGAELAILDSLADLAGLEIARAMRRPPTAGAAVPPGNGPSAAPATGEDAPHRDAATPIVASTNAVLRLWAELQTRRVVRVVAVYLAAAWLLIDVSSEVLPPLGMPDYVQTLIVLLAVLGLPLVLVTAWAFDLTDSGIMRTPAATDGTPIGPHRRGG